MATSELDHSITYIEYEEENPSTFETSEAIKQPTRKRLQKKKRNIDEEDDENPNYEVFENSERFDEPSMSHEDSGKKSKDRKHMLEEFAQEMKRMQIANEEDDDEVIDYADDDEVVGERQEKSGSARKKKAAKKRSSRKDHNDFFLEELDEKRKKEKKPKFEKPAKKTAGDVLAEMQKEEGLYTLEEEDEPKRTEDEERDAAYEEAMNALENIQRSKTEKVTKKSGGSQTIKTRNKLFGDIGPGDFVTEEEPSIFEDYIVGDIQIAKPDKKKDIGRLLTKIDQYKTEKIRVPVKRSNSGITPVAPPEITQSQPEFPVPETLPHAVSMPPASLPTMPSQESDLSSIPTTDLQKMDSSKTMNASTSSRGALSNQKSMDFKSMINSKSSIPLEDDRLLEVEVAVPHMTKAGSQTLADNTLFINFLARQTSFIDKNTIKAQFDHGNKKNDLKTLTQRLAEQHKMKKSANITLEMINTRFQTTDLKDLDKKAGKKKTEGEPDTIEEKNKENEEKDSDYNPEEIDAIDGENEFTFQGPLEGDLLKNSDKKVEQRKSLGIEDIKRLEEGEEDEEGEGDYEEGGEDEGQEGGYVEDEAEEEDFGRFVEDDEDDKKNKKKKKKQDEEEEEKGEGKKKYALDKFADLDVYFNDDGEEDSNRERIEEGERKYRKLKRIREKIIDGIKKKEKREKEREERRQRAAERMELMAGYMDLEAELGSDKEENDDMIRAIDKKDEDENEDGLDEDLDELIDYAYQEIGENDEVAFNHFFKDLIHEDRENIKKVIQRSFNNKKKRKRDEFEIDMDGDERELKKMKRMQEIIQQLEESENVFLSFGDMNTAAKKPQAPEIDDAFDDTHALKQSEIIKARHQMKKILQKKSSFETQPRDMFITSDLEVMQVLQQTGGDKKKGNDLLRQGNTAENNKPGASAMRQKTITKNSILNTKDNPKAINFFNNPLNKDIMNEYGSREGMMQAAMERQASMKPNAVNAQKTASVINNNTGAEQKPKTDKKGASATSAPVSNLNKLFSLKSNELKGPSPNKVFIFKYRNKKIE